LIAVIFMMRLVFFDIEKNDDQIEKNEKELRKEQRRKCSFGVMNRMSTITSLTQQFYLIYPLYTTRTAILIPHL
jgi:hypothetical protein